MSALTAMGCRTTMHKVEMERVDQAMHAGNRGYLLGTPAPVGERSPTREIAELQVELPNRQQPGRTSGRTMAIPPTSEAASQTAATEVASYTAPTEDISDGTIQLYTVKKGDTLWSIAKHFYGKGSLWSRIYEANRDQLPEPSRLHVGMRLQVPMDGSEPQAAAGAYEK